MLDPEGEAKKRRMRLYDSSFSELRGVLEWEFEKRGEADLVVPAYDSSRESLRENQPESNFRRPSLSLSPRGFTLDRDLKACLVILKVRGGCHPSGVSAVELRPPCLPYHP